MDSDESVRKTIEKIRKVKKPVYIFGAGKIGSGRLLELFSFYGITVGGFFDNDKNKWGTVICDDLPCYSLSEITNHKDAFFVVAVGNHHLESVKRQLLESGVTHIVPESDIRFERGFIDYKLGLNKPKSFEENENTKVPFYGNTPISNPKRKKIAVYTAITGGYDEPLNPEYLESDLMDYYLITDQTDRKEDLIYHTIPIHTIVPDEVTDNTRRNRFCKILGCDIFSEYPYNIYLDGNYLIKGKISEYINRINESGMALRMDDPPFDCVYVEALWAMYRIGDEETIKKQMYKYHLEGMPRHWGTFACGCQVRDSLNLQVRKIMREWWAEVYRYCFRDQLSFTYILWKNGMKPDDIGKLSGKHNDCEELELIGSHR